MKIADFLLTIKDQKEVVYLCAKHMLEKKYNFQDSDISFEELKSFFINYNNYNKYLNDFVNTIYKKFESSNDEVYKQLCDFFGEQSDNKYLFEFRLKRVKNQDPVKYLSLDDIEMKKSVINKLENRIKIIEESDFYRKNDSSLKDELIEIKNKVMLVKKAIDI